MTQIIPKPENLAKLVFLVRGEKVLLDAGLADLYGVATKVLNQAVKRNLERFPADFMFQLTPDEWEGMRSQIVTASILEQAQSNVVRAVNSNMVLAYWSIGREIVQELQGGEERGAFPILSTR